MLLKASQFSVIYMVIIEKTTASSMAVTKLQMKVCSHGQRLGFCQKFLLLSRKCLTIQGVNSSRTNISLTQRELLSGMR